MELVTDILSWGLLLGGSGFLLTGGIGLLRLPDLFSRMHGSGIIDTLGAVMILTGLMVQEGFSLISVKLALMVLFLMFTSPTTTHALARSALNEGLLPKIFNKRQGKKSSKT
ncbi:MAG: monovalent cation/H(+) antiporter subunit G [Rhodospirillaceae bacterium]|mgnify:CR=1 FL=1|nr:monovalent cation/H(+) antiporter subunit G [Rhodospirillaceae bacterium]